MFNLNLDLKHADELLKSPVVIFLFIIVMMSLSFHFGMSMASQDPQIICAEKVELITVQETQIQELEAKNSACISQGETACIEREQRLCRQEKETLKTNCNNLINRVLGDKPE